MKYEARPNFLKSAHLISFTDTATKAMGDKNGILKAGTVFPANDATAKGIVYNDVDVSRGDRECAVIVEGYILEDRLPEAPAQLAKDAMKEIKFY